MNIINVKKRTKNLLISFGFLMDILKHADGVVFSRSTVVREDTLPKTKIKHRETRESDFAHRI